MKRAWLGLLFLLFKLIFAGILIAVAYYVPGQGETQLRFIDYVVDIKTGALAAGAVAVLILAFYAFKFFSWVKRIPCDLKRQLQQRRQQRAKEYLLESYTAMAAGEIDLAIDMVAKSKNLDNSSLFQDIFEAQALFMAGELDKAENKFSKLSNGSATRFLGLRGLVMLRKKQNRFQDIRLLLIEALKDRPNSVWVLRELLDYNLKQLEFDKATTVVDQLRINGHIDKHQANRYHALVTWLQAQQEQRKGDQSKFESYAQQTLKLEPKLTTVTLELAQYYLAHNHLAKAIKTLERGYEHLPHIDYLPVFRAVFASESALDQYRHVEEILSKAANHRISHLILAHLAIAAKLWGQARLHITILKEKLTKEVYSLLADLEMAEHPHNEVKIKEYLQLAVQATNEGEWMCQNCHTHQNSWSIFCPSCQAFDQIGWEKPEVAPKTLSLIK
ncbi:heme biosynthesis protein HemY [Candidatus Odyssella thessalonicensis]|uniref:heme biosynthesis protein HemY n=1 Tax=Candidatus Odyssella thessalonicensis TaxID=84647 RepID=UPI000225C0A6|nr:heme biosynthesis HemY N-terminal domain-containing protein [Candidatus Odyssella thessalonicensis]